MKVYISLIEGTGLPSIPEFLMDVDLSDIDELLSLARAFGYKDFDGTLYGLDYGRIQKLSDGEKGLVLYMKCEG